MRHPASDGEAEDDDGWRRLVIAHGHGAAVRDLAHVLGRPEAAIQALRATGACRKGCRKGFVELFRLRHGREPGDADWPTPRQVRRGEYEWQAPELALLASLVGRLDKAGITAALEARLRTLTGDPAARRSGTAVQNAINRIGLQSGDVVGGITTAAAGKEIGSVAMVNQAIHRGDLRALRVGRRWVVPHRAWAEWKARRVWPPAGYVQLSTLKQPLSIRSDKLSEFARMGHVPTAVRCNPYGTGGKSTQFGTWYVDPAVAARLVDDRRAGRPMPWHGRGLEANLRASHRLWLARRHPAACDGCKAIWGGQGTPESFEDYATRYPGLAQGAKRHLTKPWTPGLTVTEIARKAGIGVGMVRQAIANGALEARQEDSKTRATQTDVTRWIARGRPTGQAGRSWISLETATKRYLFTARELADLVAAGRLASRTGTEGAMRGVRYVARQQCATLREQRGFSEREAARRAGVTTGAFRELLRGLEWRRTGAIPLATLQAVVKRIRSRPGHTLEEAAEAVGRDVGWVRDRIADGTVKVLPTRWTAGRPYLSEPMLRRLRAPDAGKAGTPTPDGWLSLGEAAAEAGVTVGTIGNWAGDGGLARVHEAAGWRYPREAVRTRARAYWRGTRYHRLTPPDWLREEKAG